MLRYSHFALLVTCLLALLIGLSFSVQPAQASLGARSSAPDPARVSAALKSAPVMFVENVSQFDAGARFQVRGGNGTIWLAEDALWVTVLEKPKADASTRQTLLSPRRPDEQQKDAPRKGVNLKLSFPGANPHPTLEPFDRLDTHVSYFTGSDPKKWHADVPVWGGVRYKDLYPGIDLEITSENGQMVQRVVARAGADLNAVRLHVDGADKMELLPSPSGRGAGGEVLRLTTAVGEYAMPLLELDSASNANLSRTSVSGDEVAAPFSKSPISHQPSGISNSSDLLYATFLGGSDLDWGWGIAVDSSGAAYVSGTTFSSDFPTTPGAFDRTGGGCTSFYDAFVVKLNRTGSALAYATFLGGSGDDWGYGIAVDSSGAAYVTGDTGSSDFPTTRGAFDTNYDGGDAYVVKLNKTGSALAYATFLGGSDWEEGYGIAIDSSGAAYVTGVTGSSDFPTTRGAFDRSYNGGGLSWGDAFAVKLNVTGSELTYATFLGGSDDDWGSGIAVDSSGGTYVTGETYSSDFPTTPGAFDTTCGTDGNCNPVDNYPSPDAYVVKLDAAGSALAYATFLGGSSYDWGYSVAIDSSGAAYVTGATYSSDFPTTPGAFNTSFNGGDIDAFVVKLNRAGSAPTYATFLGGSDDDWGLGIAVDSSGAAYVSGLTTSPHFPTTPGAFDTSFNGIQDASVVKLNAAGSTLNYGTFLGGSDDDEGYGIAVDSSGAAYVTGYTLSSDFPTTPGAFDTSFNGDYGDAFMVKLAIPIIIAVEDDDLSIQYNGWRGVIDANANGGAYRVSNVKNDKMTFKFKGSTIKWVTYKGPDQGKAVATIDGTDRPTVNLYSPTPQWNVQLTYSGLANVDHTFSVRVPGTKDPGATDYNVVVDAFIVGASTTEENSCTLKFNTWTCVQKSSASGGTYRYSATKGAVASLTFSGTSIDWITGLGPNYGKAQVLIDGVDKGTVDLYAANPQWQVVKSYTGLAATTHTIQIKVLGIRNAASKGNRVVIDAFGGPITTTGTSVQVEPQSEDDSSGDSN